MRMGILDLLHGSNTILEFISNHDNLSDDVVALGRAIEQWRSNESVDVGESGTLFRLLQFVAWKQGKKVTFIKHRTLKDRAITNDSSVVGLSLGQLLKLDSGTSQWATAAVLCGNNEAPPTPLPYKLAVTYEALKEWQQAEREGRPWQPRLDRTIERQLQAFIGWRKTGEIIFTPEQAEDYCFARAFDLMTPEEGERRWPSLRQHESDRIAAMEETMKQGIVESADHRVVQAVAMRKGPTVEFLHPDCVAKSWPQFWQAMNTAK